MAVVPRHARQGGGGGVRAGGGCGRARLLPRAAERDQEGGVCAHLQLSSEFLNRSQRFVPILAEVCLTVILDVASIVITYGATDQGRSYRISQGLRVCNQNFVKLFGFEKSLPFIYLGFPTDKGYFDTGAIWGNLNSSGFYNEAVYFLA